MVSPSFSSASAEGSGITTVLGCSTSCGSGIAIVLGSSATCDISSNSGSGSVFSVATGSGSVFTSSWTPVSTILASSTTSGSF
uniref:Uncharacterized protein n=1 Tax=Lotus japonicus TaxID=34305 RepID=I3T166_LOTJA|nr:unknown [Lotus japonicus]